MLRIQKKVCFCRFYVLLCKNAVPCLSQQVLGAAVNSYTKELYIKNQALYVQLNSSVLRQELMMNRKILVRRLNDYVGAQVIADIVFR